VRRGPRAEFVLPGLSVRGRQRRIGCRRPAGGCP
jgi:hypothetical protein